ncbi:lipocalin family protein [Ferruginibacter sp. SUN002]|uniref:lipocalin family protein n=1 Tax=Ferruginibacter sp. SUN002 TaxID=2937789 RepID=UPI003D3645AC
MRKLLIPSAFLLMIASSSCKKSDSNCGLSLETLKGTYKVTASVYKETPTSTPVDEFALWDACEKDDTVTFGDANVITFTDAGTSCDPSGSGVAVWTLSGNTLIIDGETYDVSSFSCSGMTIIWQDDTTDETGTITLKKV